MKERPETERPYEKCLRAGAESLTDGELLAVIIRCGTRSCTALELAFSLLNRHPVYKGLAGLHHLDIEMLKEIPGMRIFGEAEDKGSVISFLVGDIHHFDMGTLLDRLGIAVRTGHHCAQPLMQRLGIEGTVRASFGLYNTREEIDVLVAGIVRVSRMF